MFAAVIRVALCACVLLVSLFAASGPAQAEAPVPAPHVLFSADELDGLRARLEREPYATIYKLNWNVANWGPNLEGIEIGDEQVKGNVAKASAFIYAMNYKIVNGDIVPFDSEAERAAFAERAVEMIAHMFGQSRMTSFLNATLDIHTAQELTLYASAYGILKDAGYVFADEAAVVAPIAQLSADFYKDWVDDQYPAVNAYTNNHGSKSAAALGLAALVLYDAAPTLDETLAPYFLPHEWLEWAIKKTDLILMQAQVTRDGAYGEGVGYYYYAAINHTIFMHALRKSFSPAQLADWAIDDFYFGDFWTRSPQVLVHDWMVRIQMPDGSYPPFDDNSPGARYTFGQLTSLANGGLYRWAWERQSSWPDDSGSVRQYADTFVLFDDSIAAQSPDDLGWTKNQYLYDGGAAVFRSDWEDRDARYLIMMAEHGKAKGWAERRDGDSLDGSGGHDHNDPGAIHLMAYGETLLLDSGYMGWPDHSMVYNAHNHNILMVNGKGPALMHLKVPNLVVDENGEYVVEEGEEGGYIPGNDGDAYLVDHVDVPGLSYARMETSYFEKAPETDWSRHVIFLDESVFVVIDEAMPSQTSQKDARNYSVLWHGNGGGDSGGTFDALSDGGVWTHGDAKVTVRAASAQGALSWTVDEDIHDPGSRQPHTHNVITGAIDAERADIVSVLLPEPVDSRVADVAYDAETKTWTIGPPADTTEKSDTALARSWEVQILDEVGTVSACGLTGTAKGIVCGQDVQNGNLVTLTANELSSMAFVADKTADLIAESSHPVHLTMSIDYATRQLIADVKLPDDVDGPITLKLGALWMNEGQNLGDVFVSGACGMQEDTENHGWVFTLHRDSLIVVQANDYAPTQMPYPVLHANPKDVFVGDSVTITGENSCPDLSEKMEFAFVEIPEYSEAQLNVDTAGEAAFVPDLPGAYFVSLSLTANGEQGYIGTASHALRIDVLPAPEIDGDLDGDADAELDGELSDGDLDPDLPVDGDLDVESDAELEPETDGDLEADAEIAPDGDDDQPQADGDSEPDGDGGCQCRHGRPDAAAALLLSLLFVLALRRRLRA